MVRKLKRRCPTHGVHTTLITAEPPHQCPYGPAYSRNVRTIPGQNHVHHSMLFDREFPRFGHKRPARSGSARVCRVVWQREITF